MVRLVEDPNVSPQAAGPIHGTKLLAGRCSYCRAPVLTTRDSATGHVVVLDQPELRGRACARDLAEVAPTARPPAAIEGWDAQGRRLWVNPELTEEPQAVVHRDHARSCWATARAQGKPQPPEEGTCRGCGARMLWIRTVEGKRVPLDPAPHTGPQLLTGERAPAGGKLVRGYTLAGAMLAVLEELPPAQLFDAPAAPEATVYVSHFATCPDREAFTNRGRRSGPPPGAPRT